MIHKSGSVAIHIPASGNDHKLGVGRGGVWASSQVKALCRPLGAGETEPWLGRMGLGGSSRSVVHVSVLLKQDVSFFR